MDLHLTGKKVLVTGASQGIGEGLAEAFAAEGCDLHLVARNTEKLNALAKAIMSEYGVCVTVTSIDMSQPGAGAAIAGEAGNVDILINNAGSIPSGTLFDINDEQWRKGWELKCFGYVDMIRQIYPGMKQRGGGVILNNIGVGGEVTDHNYIEGVAGNASLMALTRALGGTSLDDNIRVVGVNPGPVNTSRIEQMLRKFAQNDLGDADKYKELLAQYPLGRAAKITEITDLFLFLASERSGYTSGVIFTVDGGLASRRSLG